MYDVILVCGVPASGKTWVCQQLKDQYHYIPHDRCWYHPQAQPGDDDKWGPPGSRSTHKKTLIQESLKVDKPLITEVPFGERELHADLTRAGLTVRVLFIVEPEGVLAQRYLARQQGPIGQSVLTRGARLAERAAEWHCFAGSSQQVLDEIRNNPSGKPSGDSPSTLAETLEQGAEVDAPSSAPLPPGLVSKGVVRTRPDGKLFIEEQDVVKLDVSLMAWVAENATYRVRLHQWLLP